MIDQLIAHYRVIRKIGEGGMGAVYLAADTKLDRQVAIKLLPATLVGDRERRQRFVIEAKAASAVNHPNVCVIHEVGETGEGQPFIVMEYVVGQPLGAVRAAASMDGGRIIEIAIQVADALDAAHARGIVHRDIKPANISVDDRGRVKVLDFGLAKRQTLEGTDGDSPTGAFNTLAGTISGTPNYMSPEQALGRSVDHRSDIFSLGVVIYELVTERLPFSGTGLGDTLNNVVHAQPAAMARFHLDLSPELERITLKCLQKSPDRRYQSARELFVDLTNLREESSLSGTRAAAASGMGQVQTSRPAAVTGGVFLNAAPPTPAQVEQSDAFITCSQIDDQPLWPDPQGWISHFQRHLKTRLEQLLGETVNVLSYPMAAGQTPAELTLIDVLPLAKTLVSVVSPPFTKSESCRRSVARFCEAAEDSGRFRVQSHSRLVKVVKTPISPSDIPPELARPFSQVLSFNFFEEDPVAGRVREFDERFGPAARQRYFERVYDVADEIHRVLTAMKQDHAAEPPRSGRVVYLASSTSDVQPEVDRIRRELTARGHEVLPDSPLPLVSGELEAAVRAYLARADLSIHPLGAVYGIIPEGMDCSLIELQNRLAADLSLARQLPRVIWIPRDLRPRDARQEALLRAVRDDPGYHRGAEVVQDNLETVKSLVLDKLNPPPRVISSREGGESERPRVYLICDKGDEAAIEPLEDFLFEQGLEVSLPDFEGDEAEVADTHRQHLLDCDAVLVFYGAARHSWVDIKLRSVLKAGGYGRAHELAARAVYIAPPFDHRKDRFRTHMADVLRHEGTFDTATLRGFVQQALQSRNQGDG